MSQMKFSSSLALLAPLKALGYGILTLDDSTRFELNVATARHNTTISVEGFHFPSVVPQVVV